MTELSMLKF